MTKEAIQLDLFTDAPYNEPLKAKETVAERRATIIFTTQFDPKKNPLKDEDANLDDLYVVGQTPPETSERPVAADPTIDGYVKEHFTDEEADDIAIENERLVYYVANRFRSSGVSIEELSSVGFYGYAKAIKTFDKNRNVKFSTYAINVIKNEICYFLRKENKHRSKNVSLNKILSTDQNGNPFELTDILDDVDTPTVDEQIITEDRLRILLEIIDRLPEKERYIILNRFELKGNKKKTQKEISEEINMSQANVSKLQKNAIQKIKFYLQLRLEDKELTLNKALEL